MRILVVCQYYYPEHFVITPICEDLVKRGHDVFVVTSQPNYGFGGKIAPGYAGITDETIHGVKVHRIACSPRKKSRISLLKNYYCFWKGSKRYLSELNEPFDLVYAMSMSPLMGIEGATLYAKKHQTPLVIHCLDLWPESAVIAGKVSRGSLEYRYLYRWSKKIYESADEILISSPSFATYFKDVLHLDKKLVVVPQPPLVSPAPSHIVTYEKKYNFIYAGNFGKLQLLENYLGACECLKCRNDWQFHLFGDGCLRGKLDAIIRQKKLEGFVVIHPSLSLEELSAYFPNATAVIVPLKWSASPVSKTIPNKLVSSLSYGLPIVASIGGDGKALLQEAGGALFAGEDPVGIAKCLTELFARSEETRAAMGKANRDFFDAYYDFSKVMDRLEAQLKDVKKA